MEATRFLIEHGADVTARKKDGSTPLHMASRGGHVRVARVLLQYGADPAARDNLNRTSYDVALGRGYRGIIRLLSVEQ